MIKVIGNVIDDIVRAHTPEIASRVINQTFSDKGYHVESYVEKQWCYDGTTDTFGKKATVEFWNAGLHEWVRVRETNL